MTKRRKGAHQSSEEFLVQKTLHLAQETLKSCYWKCNPGTSIINISQDLVRDAEHWGLTSALLNQNLHFNSIHSEMIGGDVRLRKHCLNSQEGKETLASDSPDKQNTSAPSCAMVFWLNAALATLTLSSFVIQLEVIDMKL